MMHGASGAQLETAGASLGGAGAGAKHSEAMCGMRVSRRVIAPASSPCASSHATTGNAASSGKVICTFRGFVRSVGRI